MRFAGVILCGGESSRMGTSKAMLPFGDEMLLQRVVRVVSEVVTPVVVVAAVDQQLPALPSGVSVVRDLRRERGPLEGMLAGFRAIADQANAIFVSSCDAPFLTAEFVRRVTEHLGDAQAAAPRVEGRWCPLCAVYRLETLPAIEAALAGDRLRVSAILDACQARAIQAHELADVDPELRSLDACNTPDEYQAALRELGLLHG